MDSFIFVKWRILCVDARVKIQSASKVGRVSGSVIIAQAFQQCSRVQFGAGRNEGCSRKGTAKIPVCKHFCFLNSPTSGTKNPCFNRK